LYGAEASSALLAMRVSMWNRCIIDVLHSSGLYRLSTVFDGCRYGCGTLIRWCAWPLYRATVEPSGPWRPHPHAFSPEATTPPSRWAATRNVPYVLGTSVQVSAQGGTGQFSKPDKDKRWKVAFFGMAQLMDIRGEASEYMMGLCQVCELVGKEGETTSREPATLERIAHIFAPQKG